MGSPGLLEALLGSLSSSLQQQAGPERCLSPGCCGLEWEAPAPTPAIFKQLSQQHLFWTNCSLHPQFLVGPQRSPPTCRTYENSCRLASVERKYCGPHRPHQKMVLGTESTEFWVHLLLDFYQKDLKAQEAGQATQRESTLHRDMLGAINESKQQF